ncbi:VOC family protein [uncultured Paludibaculum sp.]|uniref:VOC family protein n=1 Tax=uncultured Paludibaculum sp. TaxID=1765020 RepID=UPI002AABFF6B|nr:VOC family protein [uncultured Paludibaculum sp.]
MAVEGSTPDPGVIVPHLVVRDMPEALDFYTSAFSARVLYRSVSPSGQGEHVHLQVWSSLIQLSTEEPDYEHRRMAGAFLASPETLRGTSCVFQVAVPDVDAAYQRAVDHGALPAMPPVDMFWGDRYGWVRHPFGHMWALCTIQEVLTPDEVAARMRAFSSQMKGHEE